MSHSAGVWTDVQIQIYTLHQKKVTLSSSIFPGDPRLESETLGHFQNWWCSWLELAKKPHRRMLLLRSFDRIIKTISQDQWPRDTRANGDLSVKSVYICCICCIYNTWKRSSCLKRGQNMSIYVTKDKDISDNWTACSHCGKLCTWCMLNLKEDIFCFT